MNETANRKNSESFFAHFWQSRAIFLLVMVVKRAQNGMWDVLKGISWQLLKAISLEQLRRRETTTDECFLLV